MDGCCDDGGEYQSPPAPLLLLRSNKAVELSKLRLDLTDLETQTPKKQGFDRGLTFLFHFKASAPAWSVHFLHFYSADRTDDMERRRRGEAYVMKVH